ncbi:hypothetical protein SAMN05428947_114124 [Mucilaginibacter sp. OK283]|jgi:hypothetical protein|nr:hypothetical protein SAMN05428947_114124 [Mucilaginibacter sp. OK283]
MLEFSALSDKELAVLLNRVIRQRSKLFIIDFGINSLMQLINAFVTRLHARESFRIFL